MWLHHYQTYLSSPHTITSVLNNNFLVLIFFVGSKILLQSTKLYTIDSSENMQMFARFPYKGRVNYSLIR